jgi:predicted enzyme related to lactoylglutathione lyase
MENFMSDPNFVLLYVDDPSASVRFYSELLGHQPVNTSPDFAMFRLASGVMLGLWSKHTAEPKPAANGGGTELGFPEQTIENLRATFKRWSEKGLKIVQPLTQMGFGHTFVALDPDGHRLRAFVPSGN